MTTSQEIKKALNAAFNNGRPANQKTKFGVTTDRGYVTTITITWTGGPFIDDVRAIAAGWDTFQDHSNPYEDYHYATGTKIRYDRSLSQEEIKFVVPAIELECGVRPINHYGETLIPVFNEDYFNYKKESGDITYRLKPEKQNEMLKAYLKNGGAVDIFNEDRIAIEIDEKHDYYYRVDQAYRDRVDAERQARIDAEAKEQQQWIEEQKMVTNVLTLIPVDPYFVRADFPRDNKQSSLEEYEEQTDFHRYHRAKITHTVELTPDQWEIYTNNLLSDQDCLEGLGGTDSTYTKFPNGVEFWDAPEIERINWWDGEYVTNAILVTCGDKAIVLNPEGHNYARYVGINVVREDNTPKNNIVGFPFVDFQANKITDFILSLDPKRGQQLLDKLQTNPDFIREIKQLMKDLEAFDF
jgi:hypothetical protein